MYLFLKATQRTETADAYIQTRSFVTEDCAQLGQINPYFGLLLDGLLSRLPRLSVVTRQKAV